MSQRRCHNNHGATPTWPCHTSGPQGHSKQQSHSVYSAATQQIAMPPSHITMQLILFPGRCLRISRVKAPQAMCRYVSSYGAQQRSLQVYNRNEP